MTHKSPGSAYVNGGSEPYPKGDLRQGDTHAPITQPVFKGAALMNILDRPVMLSMTDTEHEACLQPFKDNRATEQLRNPLPPKRRMKE